jgi:hypothetical protein
LDRRSREKQIKELQVLFPSWDHNTLVDVLNSVDWDKEAVFNLLQQWTCEAMVSQQEVRPRLDPVSPFVPPSFEMPPSFGMRLTRPEPLGRSRYDRVMASRLYRHNGSFSGEILPVVSKVARHWRHVASQQDRDPSATRNEALGPLAADRELQRKLNALSHEALFVERKELLRQRCAFLGFRQHVMEDDGNCQFRAISSDLYGTQEHHELVRAMVVSYLESHGSTYKAFIGEREWRPYLEAMRKSKTWGDEITLRAAAEAFGIWVHVVTSTEENYLLAYCPSGGDPAGDARHVFLTYVAPVHYNTIRPLR